MGHPSIAQDLPSLPLLPKRNGAAVEKLLRVVRDSQPIAILVGKGGILARRLIDTMSAKVETTADIVRVPGSSLSPKRCLSSVLQGLGLDSAGLAMEDRRQILTMFLEYQKKHRRQTVLCIESAEEVEEWTLDLLNDFVRAELEHRYGLTVLFTGGPDLPEKLRESGLDMFARPAQLRIDAAPFELDETRCYLQTHLHDEGYASISDIFEFGAVTRIHELCAGVPEAVDRLVVECLKKTTGEPLTAKTVTSKARGLGFIATDDDDDLLLAGLSVPTGGRLVVRHSGAEVARRTIDQERLLIGRGALCDLRLRFLPVSRNHAAVLWTKSGVSVVDLGSTNGTIVDGARVQSYPLTQGAHIRIGDCDVEYQAPSQGP